MLPRSYEKLAVGAGFASILSTMTRNYKFRMYPTKMQEKDLHILVDQHCDLYNAALEQRNTAWKLFKKNAGYVAQASELKDLRQAHPEMAVYGHSAMQQTLRRLDDAFQLFFERKGGYPRFKAKSRFKSVRFPVGDGASFRGDIEAWKMAAERRSQMGSKVAPKVGSTLRVKGIGKIRVKQHRLLEGAVKQITVKRYASGHWDVILTCTGVPTHPLPETGEDVGIDMGCVTLVATSDGKFFENPRYLKKLQGKRVHHQRSQERAERGSKSWRKHGRLRAKVDERIARQRLDNHFKIARHLVRHYDRIAREDLRIENMTKSARGTIEEPGANVAQKAGLNRSILDAAWGQFQSVLDAIAEDAGRLVWSGPAAYSSQECSVCHHVSGGSRKSQALFICDECGHTAHADTNAATTIAYRAGLAQWGDSGVIATGEIHETVCL